MSKSHAVLLSKVQEKLYLEGFTQSRRLPYAMAVRRAGRALGRKMGPSAFAQAGAIFAEYVAKPITAPEKDFFTSREWQRLRYKAFLRYGRNCQLCGAGATPEQPLHVDHIKPRSKYPELSLRIENLQILCEPCNIGKGAWDETDWR